MPIRTNVYQFYKRCILIAQHNEQRDTPFSFYLSQTFSQGETMAIGIYTYRILMECLRNKDPIRT